MNQKTAFTTDVCLHLYLYFFQLSVSICFMFRCLQMLLQNLTFLHSEVPLIRPVRRFMSETIIDFIHSRALQLADLIHKRFLKHAHEYLQFWKHLKAASDWPEPQNHTDGFHLFKHAEANSVWTHMIVGKTDEKHASQMLAVYTTVTLIGRLGANPNSPPWPYP